MSLLQKLLRLLGVWGVAAVGILIACAVFYVSALRPAESGLQERRSAIQSLNTRSPLRPAAGDARVDNMQRFHEMFPSVQNLDREVEKLWVLATEYKIDLQSAEYRMESGNPGLIRYRVTLPLRANYVQLRLFVDTILKTIPTISIDGLRFERKKISDTQLEAQIRLTFYFRPATAAAQPSPTQP